MDDYLELDCFVGKILGGGLLLVEDQPEDQLLKNEYMASLWPPLTNFGQFWSNLAGGLPGGPPDGRPTAGRQLI